MAFFAFEEQEALIVTLQLCFGVFIRFGSRLLLAFASTNSVF